MAKVNFPSDGQKQPSLSGRVVIRVNRGRLVAQAWPRKRGKPKSPVTREQNEWFKQANLLAKYVTEIDQWMVHEVTRDQALFPRDLLMSAMRGRLFERLTVSGQEFWSMGVIQDISDDLDLVGTTGVGTLLVRGVDLWGPLLPGPTGQVLTSQGPGVLPAWATNAGSSAARVERATTLVIPASSTTTLSWDSEAFDDANYFDPASNTRLTMPAEAGRCQLNAGIRSDTLQTRNISFFIQRNGTDIIAQVSPSQWRNISALLDTGPIDFAASDFFEVRLFTTTGDTLSASPACFFTVQRLV